MSLITYTLKRISRRRLPGTTRSASCTLSAILKFDDIVECPNAVYNEIVALRLAHLANIPVAEGCLTISGDGFSYASIELGSPGITLPDVASSQRDLVAELYPEESMVLTWFDLWIGNWDRGENLKATLVSPHIRLFAGYDQGFSLLGIEDDPQQAIERLGSEELIVDFHPFFGRLSQNEFEDWISAMHHIPDELVYRCCLMGGPFRGVTVEMQESLAQALCWRKGALYDIVEEHDGTIYG